MHDICGRLKPPSPMTAHAISYGYIVCLGQRCIRIQLKSVVAPVNDIHHSTSLIITIDHSLSKLVLHPTGNDSV